MFKLFDLFCLKKLLTRANNISHISIELFERPKMVKIPNELFSPEIGDCLYQIGASNIKFSNKIKRSKIYQPKFLYCLFAFSVCQTIFYFTQNDVDFTIWFGDVSIILNIKFQYLALQLTFDYMFFGSKFSHFRYEKYFTPNIDPFALAAGWIKPEAIGLNDHYSIVKYLEIIKSIFQKCRIASKIIPIFVGMTFGFVFSTKMVQMNSLGIWFVVPFWIYIYTIRSQIVMAFLYYHMLHFLVVCYYLR